MAGAELDADQLFQWPAAGQLFGSPGAAGVVWIWIYVKDGMRIIG